MSAQLLHHVPGLDSIEQLLAMAQEDDDGREPVGESEPVERLLTAAEVAETLGVSRKFVYARHRSGALRGYKLGPYYRFRRGDVEAFLEASTGGSSGSVRRERGSRRAAAPGSFRALREATGEA